MTYIHHIDPILLPIHGDIAVRWYGISYLLGFIASILLLRHWSKRGEFEVPAEETSNFVVLLAFFGVFLGGRLGYVLLYGFDAFLADPLYPFKVWEGGMASHGGFLGVILFILWYAKKQGHSFWNLSDHFACTASLGLTFGRLANFINGELWGRPTRGDWGVAFPQELGWHYGEYQVETVRQLVETGTLPLRHPSQLYQAAGEGLLVFAIMLLLRRTAWGRRPGAASAAYLALYAVARIAMECFREPDNGAFLFGHVSKGQFYSVLLLLGSLGIIAARRLFTPANSTEKKDRAATARSKSGGGRGI